MKKLSRQGFMGVPLTSQEKTGSWYAKFEFLGKSEYAAVCQARVMSVSRLHSKLGHIPESDLEIVKKAFQNHLNKKCAPPKRGTRVTSNIPPLYQTLSILSTKMH